MQTVTFNSIEKLDFRTKESYKTLRTNLEFSGKDRKVISITSSTPNEGKTSVSFQLALSIAEGGKAAIKPMQPGMACPITSADRHLFQIYPARPISLIFM